MNEIPILWDGGYLIAVEKPRGLSTQAPPGGDSLENRLRVQLAGRTEYLAIVHRLDREVGGVMLVALRKKEARLICDQFSSRKVIKQYTAIVHGRLEPASDVWIDHLRKIPDRPVAEVCAADADGAKQAETRIELISFDEISGQTKLSLFPHTGRMHQLRVQAAHRGHAIVGDTVYGESSPNSAIDDPSSSELMLRAESIVFHDPKNGRITTARASALPSGQAFG